MLKKLMRVGLVAVAIAGANVLSAASAFAQEAAKAAPTLNPGDTAFMMLATVLVLLMTVPGLALFYGGLVRAKNTLSVLTQVLAIVCLISLIWLVYGYSLAFTEATGFVGGFSKVFLAGVTPASLQGTIPEYVFICFQMTFACITTALIVGGFAERMRFSAVLLFAGLWVTFVYVPIAHMVWEENGFLARLGALDFAGGTVVHINSGVAALVGAIMIGKRTGYGKDLLPPHSLPLTMIGGVLLWVGWFGFNAGSALAADGKAALAVVNTFAATAAAGLAWMVAEWLDKGKPSMLGLVSGLVAGLVAVTPAAGFAGPMGSIVLGIAAGIVSMLFCTSIKNALGYDDSLDVFGIHAVSGILGSLATGILVSTALGGTGVDDYTMGLQLWKQLVAVVVAIVWCGVVSLILYKVVDVLVGLRAPIEQEREGLDLTEHGERAYT